jgi:hypothetical protein
MRPSYARALISSVFPDARKRRSRSRHRKACASLQADQEFDKLAVLSVLVLWTRYGAGKLGILRLKPVREDEMPVADEYEEWEGKAIAAYLHRHNL